MVWLLARFVPPEGVGQGVDLRLQRAAGSRRTRASRQVVLLVRAVVQIESRLFVLAVAVPVIDQLYGALPGHDPAAVAAEELAGDRAVGDGLRRLVGCDQRPPTVTAQAVGGIEPGIVAGGGENIDIKTGVLITLPAGIGPGMLVIIGVRTECSSAQALPQRTWLPAISPWSVRAIGSPQQPLYCGACSSVQMRRISGWSGMLGSPLRVSVW